MPAPSRRTLLLCLLCSPAAADPAFTSAAEQPFTLESLMARMAAARPRRARFIETRRYAALATPLESRGWLSFEGGRLVKMTEWPESERMEVDGQRIVITTDNEPPRVIDMGAAPPLRVLVDAVRGPLSGDIGALRRGFAIKLTGTLAAWSLHLVPRAAGPDWDVRLDGAGDAITRIAVVRSNGDQQVTVISPS